MSRFAILVALSAVAAFSQPIVTVQPHGQQAPEIHREEVSAYAGSHKLHIDSWTPSRGEHAGLEFYILIDDGSSSTLGSHFGELRAFITSQPATTKIGLGYIRNGAVSLAQALTADHAAVSKALRLPLAEPGIAASPYLALVDLIKKWPASADRREVLLITNGLDLFVEPPAANPDLQRAIREVQRADVVAYSIYFGRDDNRINWGPSYLAALADETGGESYWQGNENPVSFEPYLKDLGRKLENQYRVVLEGGQSSDRIKLTSEVPHLQLRAPAHFETRPGGGAVRTGPSFTAPVTQSRRPQWVAESGRPSEADARRSRGLD